MGAAVCELVVGEVGCLSSNDMAYDRSTYDFKKADGSAFDNGK